MNEDYFGKEQNDQTAEPHPQLTKPAVKFKHIQNRNMIESVSRTIQFFLNQNAEINLKISVMPRKSKNRSKKYEDNVKYIAEQLEQLESSL